jgi:hypothetical protein
MIARPTNDITTLLARVHWKRRSPRRNDNNGAARHEEVEDDDDDNSLYCSHGSRRATHSLIIIIRTGTFDRPTTTERRPRIHRLLLVGLSDSSDESFSFWPEKVPNHVSFHHDADYYYNAFDQTGGNSRVY